MMRGEPQETWKVPSRPFNLNSHKPPQVYLHYGLTMSPPAYQQSSVAISFVINNTRSSRGGAKHRNDTGPKETCRRFPWRVRRSYTSYKGVFNLCWIYRIFGFLFGFSLASSFAAYHLLDEYKQASAALQASVEELQISTEKVRGSINEYDWYRAEIYLQVSAHVR